MHCCYCFPQDNYHTDKYIYPVGFTSSRLFTDYTNTDKKCRYVSRILGGEKGPTVCECIQYMLVMRNALFSRCWRSL
jgi:hypothetical protein